MLVLAGAQRTLKETEAVILEVTLFETRIGGLRLYGKRLVEASLTHALLTKATDHSMLVVAKREATRFV